MDNLEEEEYELEQPEEDLEKFEELTEEQKREIELTSGWDDFIDSLIEAEGCWERIRKTTQKFGSRGFENLPYKVQKGLSKYHRNTFLMMLPDFVGHWRAYGGLENQKSNS